MPFLSICHVSVISRNCHSKKFQLVMESTENIFFHTYILMSTFFMLLHLKKNVFGMRCRQVEVETLSCLFCFSYSISRISKQSDLRQGYVFHICSLHLFGDVLLFLSIIICPFTKHLLPFKLSFSLSYTYTHPLFGPLPFIHCFYYFQSF